MRLAEPKSPWDPGIRARSVQLQQSGIESRGTMGDCAGFEAKNCKRLARGGVRDACSSYNMAGAFARIAGERDGPRGPTVFHG